MKLKFSPEDLSPDAIEHRFNCGSWDEKDVRHIIKELRENATLRAELERLKGRKFPLLMGYGRDRAEYGDCPTSVPWARIASFDKSAIENHSQSLEELASRGGLSPEELWCAVNNAKLSRDSQTIKPKAVDLVKKLNEPEELETLRTTVARLTGERDARLYEAYLLGCEDECIPEPKTLEQFIESWRDK